MANTSKEVKQRYQEAAYIEVGETYELAGTGFEKLDEEPGHRLLQRSISMINPLLPLLHLMKERIRLQRTRFFQKR